MQRRKKEEKKREGRKMEGRERTKGKGKKELERAFWM